ncbi:MAG: hypothetical protein CGW95_04930 [Phenylobacterium zucineum]|nr:MAG: hypothetical protein CGW95_04930 [Phenylobacterium zucineum]
MYGMVHRAARQMVLDLHGENHWSAISAASGLGDDAFIGANVYGDEVTLKLVAAISDHFEAQVESMLRAFGEYWISFAYNGDYKSIMTMAGQDLVSFLYNLNRMHDSVQISIPGARLPTFVVDDDNSDAITLSYFSDRTGLEPFVEGLLSGLIKHFGQTGNIHQIGRNGSGVQFQIVLSNP